MAAPPNEHRASEVGVISSVNRVRSVFLSRLLHPAAGILVVTAVVFASISAEDAAFAGWRHLDFVRTIAAVFIAICCVLLFALAYRVRTLERRNRELREARTTLSDAIESIAEAFVVWDPDDRLVICNEPARAAYGKHADLLLPGQRFEDLLRQAAHRGVYGDLAGHVEEWLAERVAAHRQPSGTVEQRLADGRTMLVVEHRMKNGGSAGLRVDITRLKQAEAQLRDTMEHLIRVQGIAGIGSTTENLATKEYEWSEGACAIFGIDIGDAGKTVEYMRQFYHPADREKVIEAGELARLNSAAAPPLEYRIVRPDGAVRWVYRQNDIQHDAEGRAICRIVTFKDITEQRCIEDSLREAKDAAEAANIAKSQFLANMSHELRTPLNAIVGFSETLELGILGPLLPKQREYVSLIRQSGDHLRSVINDILDLAKVDAGKLELHEEAGVDPLQIIEACGELVAARVKEGALTLSAETGPDLPLLIADSTRLKQILLNLVTNAVKFTDPGGKVILAAWRTRAGGIAFEVRDTGPGMTEEEIKIALEPFGQVDARLARRHEGTGLGLPLARRLAELHDGSLQIRSIKGCGTTVTVTLPAEKVLRNTPLAVSAGVAA